VERRKAYRVSVPEVFARCSTGEVVGYYGVHDVSTGGALLVGRPLPPVGADLEVLLLLPGQRPCVLEAHVLRQDRPAHAPARVAVEFDEVSADIEDAIEDFIADELTRQLRPTALVAADGADGEALERSLRQAGCPAILVRTPLDAITRLEQPDGAVGTVFVGETFGGLPGGELAAFLGSAYPEVRRVMIAHLPAEVTSATIGGVDAILPAPWTDSLVDDVLAAVSA
jgi:hypothetical protein